MNKGSNMMTLWIMGSLLHRSGRMIASALGVMVTVAMLVSLGIFIVSSAAAMTMRAVDTLPVDLQVQLVPGIDPQTIGVAARQSAPVASMETVGYADVSGFTASTQNTVQTTGAGKVIGITPEYVNTFPTEFRSLVGTQSGVLVAQQTAANLHLSVGDVVAIQRIGLPPVDVTVAGVVDLPYADTFFQAVGVPANAAPQAPPDNVIFLPLDQWHNLFNAQSVNRPDSTRLQLHIRLQRNLPTDPNAAFLQVQRETRNLEARIAGSGVIGDNLAARLDGVRSDALYARVLFLFLGLPGVLLAMILTLAVAATGSDRRRQEQALLRVRGASIGQILQLAAMEGLVIGLAGSIIGVAAGWLVVHWIAPVSMNGSAAAVLWTLGAAMVGVTLAVAATLRPAWESAHHSSIAAARQSVGRYHPPFWQPLYLDVIFLVVAAAMFWRTAGVGYELVLAPEGVAQVSVSYEAFIAPLCLWIGSALLIMRLGQRYLTKGRRSFQVISRPLTRNMAGVVFASMERQRLHLSQGMALIAMAVIFAVSTAVFNTTYDTQARVDAELTNGADILVQGTTSGPAGSKLAEIKALPGVVSAQPLQHRYAYVGADLQDLYGIDPAGIGQTTHLANAYFANHNAQAALASLAAHPDGVLISEETKNDYQLTLGDRLNLRIQHTGDNQYHVVPFTFIGVVREFPTAPKDSFLVANASYIKQQTGSDAAEIVLVKTKADPATVYGRIQQEVRNIPGIKVTDIGAAQKAIGSSLTAVNLRGLTTLELSFAVLLAASASGLILALGFEERKKTFASLMVVGAKSKHLGAFVWSEGLALLTIGGATGALAGLGLAQLLVLMLTHIFDPPPEILVIPWGYLMLLVVALATATAIAVVRTIAAAKHAGVAVLRSL